MDNLLKTGPDNDTIYIIKAILLTSNSDAIFFEFFDCALIGTLINSHGKHVAVYNKHTMVERYGQIKNIGACHAMSYIYDLAEKCGHNENDPVILDLIPEDETIEMDKLEIEKLHYLIKNPKLKNICL